MIYNRASAKFVDFMIGRRLASSEHRELYTYCMERALSQIGNLLLLFILGGAFGKIRETLVFVAFYCSLRRFSGGAHANTHGKCIGTYILMLVASMFLAWLLSPLPAIVWIVPALLVAAIILVFKYAPVDCPNRRFAPDSFVRLRRWSRCIVLIESVAILQMLFFSPYFATLACFAIFCQSSTLLPAFQVRGPID